jgi:alanine racemase
MVLNWIELSSHAIGNNIGKFRRRIGDSVVLGAVIKANAYGHGMLEIAEMTQQAGVDWFCVDGLEEGVALRQAGHKLPILIMGYIPLDSLETVVEENLRPVLTCRRSIERLNEIAVGSGDRVAVHLEIETGTYRQGIPETEIQQLAGLIADAEALSLEGLCTHFANIEDTTDHDYAEMQIERFGAAARALKADGHDIPVRHTACSAAGLLFTRTHLDMIRLGISLYGYWPSRETYVASLERGKPSIELLPVMTWKTRIAQLTTVPEGSFIGYGCSYRVTRNSRIALLPVGYHDGYDRELSGIGHVIVKGRRAPVRGRICMNMFMVDVTDIPGVEQEDEVVLLGQQGDEQVTAEHLASWCGTISYEILARIQPAFPRVIV